MMTEFEEYIEEKIKNSNPMELEMNETILSLYKKGLIQVYMEEGEPMITVSEKGHELFLADFALSMMRPIEE